MPALTKRCRDKNGIEKLTPGFNIESLQAAKECHSDPVEKRGKQSRGLGIAGGTGILPVILMDRRDACGNIDSSQ